MKPCKQHNLNNVKRRDAESLLGLFAKIKCSKNRDTEKSKNKQPATHVGYL